MKETPETNTLIASFTSNMSVEDKALAALRLCRKQEREKALLLHATKESYSAFWLTMPLLEGSKYDFPGLSCRKGVNISKEALTQILGPDFEAIIDAESAREDDDQDP